MDNLKEILKGYREQISKDLELNRLNLEDFQLKLPGKKHYYVSLLIQHKQEIDSLNNLYQKALNDVSEKLIKEAEIRISKPQALKSAESHELVQKIKAEIRDNQLIVEYLEKVEKIFSNASYDVSNLINIIKLETM